MHRFVLFLILILALLYAPSILAETARGIVFCDSNRNGALDQDEVGIPDVMVTNQRDIVKTDTHGKYVLDLDEDDIISVIKPGGYELPVDQHNLPKFFYIHNPQGSPVKQFPGVFPTGPLPPSVDFPLIPSQSQNQFRVIVFSDPQSRDREDIAYLRDDVVSELIDDPTAQSAVFGVSLGDVMFDFLDLYDEQNEVISRIGKPWFNVIGNHDINYDAPTDEYSDETWHRVFGPNYYAFQQGQALFVALDNIHWEHTSPEETASDKEPHKKGKYEGRFGQVQLAWLAALLEHIPKDRLLILMFHIPLENSSGAGTHDRSELYRILEGRKVLAFAGHTHTQEHVFIGKNSGFNSKPEIHHHISITACGAWWKGMKDERGIPNAITSDGLENGYTLLEVDGNDYTTTYKACGRSWDYQLRIGSPVGEVTPEAKIVVNAFGGSSRSVVNASIDGEPPFNLKHTPMADPFVVRLNQDNRPGRDWKTQGPHTINPHLFSADLPAGLSPGLHSLSVVETDQYGREHRTSGFFVLK